MPKMTAMNARVQDARRIHGLMAANLLFRREGEMVPARFCYLAAYMFSTFEAQPWAGLSSQDTRFDYSELVDLGRNLVTVVFGDVPQTMHEPLIDRAARHRLYGLAGNHKLQARAQAIPIEVLTMRYTGKRWSNIEFREKAEKEAALVRRLIDFSDKPLELAPRFDYVDLVARAAITPQLPRSDRKPQPGG